MGDQFVEVRVGDELIAGLGGVLRSVQLVSVMRIVLGAHLARRPGVGLLAGVVVFVVVPAFAMRVIVCIIVPGGMRTAGMVGLIAGVQGVSPGMRIGMRVSMGIGVGIAALFRRFSGCQRSGQHPDILGCGGTVLLPAVAGIVVVLTVLVLTVVVFLTVVMKTRLVSPQIFDRNRILHQEGIRPVVEVVTARHRAGYDNQQQAHTHRDEGGQRLRDTAHQHMPTAVGHGVGSDEEQTEQTNAQEEDGIDQKVSPDPLRSRG